MNLISKIGIVAGFLMPFFNIPLIARILKRRSADDISIPWVTGVWICILLMTPSALTSQDVAFRAYGVTNVIFFTAVFFVTIKYHKRKDSSIS